MKNSADQGGCYPQSRASDISRGCGTANFDERIMGMRVRQLVLSCSPFVKSAAFPRSVKDYALYLHLTYIT